MALLVIKEDVCPEAMQEGAFVLPCQEQRFIDSDAPAAQRADDAFMRGGATRRYKRGSYWGVFSGILSLQSMQCRQEGLEGSAGQWLIFSIRFDPVKFIEPLFLVNPFCFIREDYGIAIESNT